MDTPSPQESEVGSANKRTVAIFDILGFKDMVKTTPLAKLVSRMRMTLDHALPRLNRSVMHHTNGIRLIPDSETRESWCLRYSFSDTIVLISDDETEQACLRLLLYAFRMLQYFTVARLYARGGVSFGEMSVDTQRQIFLGTALIEAHELEASQDWIGCAISDSVERQFPQIFEKPTILNNVFPFYEVPMKAGPVRRLRTINWRWNLVAEPGTATLFQSPQTWPERRKVENTLSYAKFIRSHEMAYPQTNDYPVELHVAFVGNGPPPAHSLPTSRHGDDL